MTLTEIVDTLNHPAQLSGYLTGRIEDLEEERIALDEEADCAEDLEKVEQLRLLIEDLSEIVDAIDSTL